MTMKKNILAGVFLCMASSMALAVADWTDAAPVAKLNQQPAGDWAGYIFAEINVTYNPTDASACTKRNGFYFAVTDDRRKRIFTMLMAAQLSGKSVRVYATGNCQAWGYAEIDGVYLQ